MSDTDDLPPVPLVLKRQNAYCADYANTITRKNKKQKPDVVIYNAETPKKM